LNVYILNNKNNLAQVNKYNNKIKEKVSKTKIQIAISQTKCQRVNSARDVKICIKKKWRKLILDVKVVVLPLKKTFRYVLSVSAIFTKELNFSPQRLAYINSQKSSYQTNCKSKSKARYRFSNSYHSHIHKRTTRKKFTIKKPKI
jgi:hypothetical protein